MTSAWDFFKDFGGPLATVVGASAAAFITYRFGTIQAAIAAAQLKNAEAQKEISDGQRRIAFDKLKWDLFGKRYEIYATAGELIDHINGTTFDRAPGGEKIVAMLRKLDEARFFFPKREALVFADIGRLVQQHEMAISSRNLFQNNEEVRRGAGDKAADASQKLRDLRVALPELMEKELGFAQLTSQPALK